MRRYRRASISAATAVATAALTLTAVNVAAGRAAAAPAPSHNANSVGGTSVHEVTTWAASDDQAGGSLTSITVRDLVHTTVGGSDMRLRLSNAYGTSPVTFSDVYVGRPLSDSSPALVPGSNQQVTFGGSTAVTIPAGGIAVSDTLPGQVPAHDTLAVSIALDGTSSVVTAHNRAMQYTFKSVTGDYASDESGAPYQTQSSAWYWLDAVLVSAPRTVGTVAALGDSITDGVGSTINANRRWTDDLSLRLSRWPEPEQLGVDNEGISGNRLLAGGRSTGQAGETRLVRDVLTKPGVSTLILFEGINDISGGASADAIIAGYQQVVAQARAMGVCVIGATITPAGYPSGDPHEQVRLAVNHFIRTSGIFAHVIDFDQAVRDPSSPNQLLPAYDSGDHIHPSDAGYQAMADAINLADLRC